MRKSLWVATVAFGLLLASNAKAQFANRSLGGSLGYVKLMSGGVNGVNYALPLSLEGTLYIENGWDLYAHIPLMLVQVKLGANTASGAGLVFGTGGHLGIRYLLLEENIRPYIGAELAGFVLFTSTTEVFVGPGIAAGVDFFVADTVSIGLRGFFDLFIELNVPVLPSVGGGVSFAFYF